MNQEGCRVLREFCSLRNACLISALRGLAWVLAVVCAVWALIGIGGLVDLLVLRRLGFDNKWPTLGGVLVAWCGIGFCAVVAILFVLTAVSLSIYHLVECVSRACSEARYRAQANEEPCPLEEGNVGHP